MSEMKRVAFSTLTTDLSSVRRSSNGNFSAAALFQDEEAMPPPGASSNAGSSSSSAAAVTSQNNHVKTFRHNLELFDPNADSFPEFYYSKLVHAEKKKIKKQCRLNGGLDTLDENDDDIARIAKEFEKKYSGSYGGKGRRNKQDDYYDKGAGYDESDSFIDNTEAYDEIIPEEIETVGGGFYINCGALEFTHLAEEEKIKPGKSKKRALSTSSSSGDDDDDKKADKKKADKVDSNDPASRSDGNVSPKESSSNPAESITHPEKKVRIANPVELTSSSGTHKDKKSDKGKDADSENGSDSEKDKEKDKDKVVVKTTTVKDMLKANRDNFRKRQQEEDAVKGGGSQMVNGGDKDSDSDDSSASSSESDVETEPPDKKRRKSIEGDLAEKIRTSDVKLPEELPADILQDIERFKTIVRSSNPAPGKCCSFTDQLTEILLRIDDACSCIEKGRALVYGHLEYQLTLEKYYLLRKVRTLRIQEENNKTKRAFMKLKKAVSEAMPSIVLNHDAEYKKVDEIRAYASQFPDKKLPKHPKKRFLWNDSIRNLLFDLYQVRWTSYVVLRTRKDNLNDFITNYFKEKVVPIWPQGWMKYEELQKELEKRKKRKENEKSEDDAAKSQRKVDADKMPSILSNNSNAAIVSNKELVVTISTKSDKKTEVPLASGDSVTVIPIPTDASSNRSKASDGGVHQKTSKSTSSTISNPSLSITPLPPVVRSGSPSITNSTNSGNGKSGHASQQQTNHTSSKPSSESKSSSSISGSNISSSQGGQVASKRQPSVSPTLDLTSPVKKATDHSINSIMSSPQSLASSTQHSSNGSSNVSTTGAVPSVPNTTSGKSSGAGSDTAITHVITVDNLQNTSDIISTSNKLISSSSTASGTTSSNLPAAPITNGTIRVRNVSSVNSSLERDLERRKDKLIVQDANRPASRESSTTIEEFNLDTESDSDGVEIVGVFPALNKKKQKHTASTGPSSTSVSLLRPGGKLKDVRSSKSSSRSASPNIVANSTAVQHVKKEHSHGIGKSSTVNSRYNDLEHAKKEAKASATGEKAATEACPAAESELDVLQIMQALKELEAMQSNIHITNRKSPTSNRPGGGSHASPINYI